MTKTKDFFTHHYNLEELITYFAKQNDNIYYLDTSSGLITENSNISNQPNTFAFKPLETEYVLQKLNLNKNNENILNEKIDFTETLNTKNSIKRDLYNIIKEEALNFLAQNNILPPSLHPIIGFKEEQKNKITIEIN